MRLGDLFGALRRLWVLSVVVALLVVAAVVLVVRATPPTYEYTASVLLLPPEISRVSNEETDYTRANPLFYLGSLTQARDILIGEMSAKDVREQMEDDFPDTDYAVTPDVLSSGPVVVVKVESTDEDEGSRALDELTDSVPDRLQELQRGLGVKNDAMIQSHPLTRDTTPTVRQTTRLRQGIMAGGALTLVGLFLIGLVDALRRPRRGGRHDG